MSETDVRIIKRGHLCPATIRLSENKKYSGWMRYKPHNRGQVTNKDLDTSGE